MAKKHKEINISQVAKQANVSVASVSRVLNNYSDVSEKLRKKVMEVIESTSFSPNKANERVFRVNVIIGVGDITDYIATLLTGIELAAEEESIEISIQRWRGRLPLLRQCRIWRSDAVVVISGGKALLDEIPSLAAAGIPCMLVNRIIKNFDNVGYIHNETGQTTRQALQYLNAQGHRKIAYMAAAPMTAQSYADRLQAYREFMESINEPIDKLLAKPHPIGHIDGLGRDMESGYQRALTLLAQNPEVTALMCANDELAVGCYKACSERNLRIPEDISIVGCDDQSAMRFLTPGLTTLRLQLTQTGKRAIHYIADFLRGNLDRLPQERLMSELVVRGSVAPPRQENGKPDA